MNHSSLFIIPLENMSRQINLSVINDNPPPVPEEIQSMGKDAIQIIWQTSQDIAQQEIEAIKKGYKKYEAEVLQQRQEALNQVNKVNAEIVVIKSHLESFKRESRSLEVDLNRKMGELKSAEDQVALLQEKTVQQEHEVKHLTEESSRLREQLEGFKKRLHEVSSQAEKDRTHLKEAHEELAVNKNNRERLESELRSSKQEADDVWKQLKAEQRRAAVANALVQEMKETNQKYEVEIKRLKEEKHELRATLEKESKARGELDKKLSLLTGRSDSQEAGYKDVIGRLEHELEKTRSEAAQLRNRMIKAEAGFEREKKALQRLETKLVAASEAKA
jgi:chromosome segregation ATPase